MVVNEKYYLLRKVLDTMVKGDPFLFFSSFYPTIPVEPINVYGHQAALLLQLMPRRPIRVLIGDEVGLGKTIEAIAIMRYLERRGEIQRVLILLPRVLIQQWSDELRRMGVDNSKIYTLETEDIKNLSETLSPGYYITSIDLAKRDYNLRILEKYDWDVLVVDEVHNCGNNKRGEAVEKLSKKSTHILLLSATPHRGDSKGYLWRLKILDPNINIDKADSSFFYRRTHNVLLFRRTKNIVNSVEGKEVFKRCDFVTAIVEPTEKEKMFMEELVDFLVDILRRDERNKALQLIAVILKKRASSSPNAALITFRKILENLQRREVSREFPEISPDEIDSILGDDYTQIEIEEDEDLDDEIHSVLNRYSYILTDEDIERLNELLQLGREIMDNDTKLNTVANLIRYHTELGEKVIVFTEYRDTLNYILPKIKEAVGEDSVVHLSGVNKKDFEDIKREFWRNPSVKVLVATDVAAEGLNLQIANVVINYEPPWSPIKIDQRIGRVWRIGQEKDVKVYNVILGVRGDRDVVEKLYTKIMNVTEALEDTKPLLGRDAEIYRATATAERGFWKVDTEFSDEKETRRPSKVSEFNLMLEGIEGNLDRYINELLAMLRNLNSKVEEYSIYPEMKANNIRDYLNKICSSTTITKYKNPLDTILINIGRHFNKEPASSSLRRVTDTVNALFHINYLGGLGDMELKNPIELVSFAPGYEEGEERAIYLVGNEHWEIPVLYVKGKNPDGLLMGSDLISYLADIYSHELLATSSSTIKVDKLAEIKVKRKASELIKKISSDVQSYIETCKQTCGEEITLNSKILPSVKGLKATMIAKIVHSMPSKGKLTSWSTTREKADVEEAAMKVVMEYEKRHGRNPEDVSGYSHYDIKSVDSEGNIRYIEVKGHTGMRVFAVLTEKEFEEAKKLREKYWLYIVANLRKTPKGIDTSEAKVFVFNNPIETMDYEIHTSTEVRFVPKN